MKKVKYSALISVCWVMTIGLFTSAVFANKGNDSPEFGYELVNFAADSSNLSRLDCYLKVTYSELQFIKASKKSFRATYKATIIIQTKDGKEIDKQSFKDDAVIDDIKQTSSTIKFKLNKVTFSLPPDEYQVLMQLQDMETDRTSEKKAIVTLNDYSGSEMLISHILFLDRFMATGKQITFQPRVSSDQSYDMKLYAYFEVYNIPQADSFTVRYEVLDSGGTVLQSEQFRNKSNGRITQNVVEIAGDLLTHGSYKIKINAESSGDSVAMEGRFDWYVAGLPKSFTNIDQAINAVRYIATKEEYAKLQKLPKKKKYEAFVAFWKKRDPTPETAENEYRREYYKRIVYANQYYHGLRKEGWKTDMGWVYVMLGAPDSIEREPYNQNFAFLEGRTVKAIQVWIYYKYNRQFIFFDVNGFGEYELENPDTLYEILK